MEVTYTAEEMEIVRDIQGRICELYACFSERSNHPVSNNFYRVVIDVAEESLITTALEIADHNQSKAATALGISRATLHGRMKRFNLPKGEY